MSDSDPWALDDHPVAANVATLPEPPLPSSAEPEFDDHVQACLTPASVTPHTSVHTPVVDAAGLNPEQRRVLDEVLEVGGTRPVTPAGLAEALRTQISEVVTPAMSMWSEPSLWVSKSALVTVHRCEGNYLADAAQPRRGLSTPIAVGQVSHRGIQVAHTHPGQPVEVYVRSAVDSYRAADSMFEAFWQDCGMATQSDVITSSVAKVAAFLDAWPALLAEWTPRFEDGVQAKVSGVAMSARPDLTLGRPRADMRQSMVLVDFKTGSLREEHRMEALYYALVHALRYEVAPFKSVVYSLSSGEWVAPSIEAETLHEAASWVATGVEKMVQVRAQLREPLLLATPACRWCPVQLTCPAANQEQALP